MVLSDMFDLPFVSVWHAVIDGSLFGGEMQNLLLWSCWLSVCAYFYCGYDPAFSSLKVSFSFLYSMNAVSFCRSELYSFFKHLLIVVGHVVGARYGKMISHLDFK